MKKLVLLFGICLSVYACSKSDDNPPPAPLKYELSVEASEGGSVSSTGGHMIRTLPFWSRQPLIKDMSFLDGLELPFRNFNISKTDF